MKSEEVIIQQSIVYASVITVVLLVFLLIIFVYAYLKSAKKNRELLDLLHERSNFFRNITHEFRTPITVILGLNNELKTTTGLSSKESKSFMDAIDRQGLHMLRLVNQLLTMSKINAGMDNIQWEKGNIVSYLEMVIDSLRVYAKDKEQSIFFLSYDSTIVVDFVPEYIENILQNLLSNAIKFSPPKSIIQVSVKRNNDHFILEVADQGIGISKEHQRKIFDLFYQVSKTASENGSGIGLSYAKQMVESMKGYIEIESDGHIGSVFRVIIPMHQNESVNITPVNKKSSDATDLFKKSLLQIKLPQQSTEETVSTKILLIEDSSDLVLYLRSMLESRFEVVAVDDGVKGLDLAHSIIPDIIISDIVMPNKDGFMLCKDVRISALLNHIPIILLTAKNTVDDRIKGMQYGADAYIIKPFTSNELLAQIDALLENRRLLKEKYMHYILKGDKSQPSDLSMGFLQKATDIIYYQMHDPNFSVITLAEKLSISTSQLNRKLTAVSGYSPSSFISRLRIESAKNKLEKDDKHIGTIAEECGYYDLAYFSRTFKKITSFSPSQYRRLHR